jgi:hypothetical protein
MENRTIARQMTLLREATGRDLDALLQDYGLRRYLDRPDAYARQIGMQCLWIPKGTTHAVRQLADLLFDLPTVTLETGPGEVHVLVADTHPITTPTSYWTLTSREGYRYAVTVVHGFGWISQMPPPGLDVTPPGRPLAYVAVDSDDANQWYLFIQGDTLWTSTTPPAWGSGAVGPLQVRDGQGTLCTFRVLSGPAVLTPVVVSTGQAPITILDPGHPFQAVSLLDAVGGVHWLWVWRGIAFLDTTPPAGSTNVTPAGGPYRWLRLYGPGDSLWYGFPSASNVWSVTTTSPGGLGTNAVQTLGDPDGVRWQIGVTTAGTFGVSDAPAIDYGTLTTALVLRDATGRAWYWRIHHQGMADVFEVSDVLWPDAIPGMPWGDIWWLQMLSTTGQQVYVFPDAHIGVPVVALAPPPTAVWGWTDPLTLRDNTGQWWGLSVNNGVVHYDADTSVSDLPPRAPLLNIRDAYDAFYHVKSAGSLVTVLIS